MYNVYHLLNPFSYKKNQYEQIEVASKTENHVAFSLCMWEGLYPYDKILKT